MFMLARHPIYGSQKVWLAEGATPVEVLDVNDYRCEVDYWSARANRWLITRVHCGPAAPLPEAYFAEPRWVHRLGCFVELTDGQKIYARVECYSYRQPDTRRMLADHWGVNAPLLFCTPGGPLASFIEYTATL